MKTLLNGMGTSLKDMLILNQTIEYLEIIDFSNVCTISSTHLSFLTTGLSHNTSLQELSIIIPLSDANNEQIKTFFNISQKNQLTEIKLVFELLQSFFYDDMKRASLFYEQVLPLVTNMLESHTTIRLLEIKYNYFSVGWSPPIDWIALIRHYLHAIFLHMHPSLQCIGIMHLKLIQDTLKTHRKRLSDQHKNEYPLKPLPILYWLS